MLKVNSGITEISGTKETVLAELTVLMQTLVKQEVCTLDDIDECVKLSKKTEEELKKDILDILLKMLDSL